VALPEVERSSALISGGDRSDRFVVALLRACADAVVIGAGTLRAHRGPWTAEAAFPDGATDFGALRRRLDVGREPTLVVVTGSGRLGAATSKMRGGIVATTPRGAERARADLGDEAEVVVVGRTEPLDVTDVMATLAERGHRRILTEGGPRLMGALLEARAVDELFLTVSPILAGGGERPRPTLSTGVDLLAIGSERGRLLSVRSHGSFLFLRYGLSAVPPR
jgi:riboflavin biosynthesis pyrimidine reductase